MSGARLLVVEDDPVINQAVTDRLRAEGFVVRQAHDGRQAVDAYAAEGADLVVLDVMLPGLDGHEVCRRIQAECPVPVLMLTARDDESDVLVGLAVGADDYLTKPFRARELVARVRALLRRVERAAELAASAVPGTVEYADLRIDAGGRTVSLAGAAVHLTPTEFDLLVVLAARPEQVITREELLSQVWGWPAGSASRTVDSHVKSLRAKLGAERIRTSHGVGYALTDPAAR